MLVREGWAALEAEFSGAGVGPDSLSSSAPQTIVAPLHLMTTPHTCSPRKRNSQKPHAVIRSRLSNDLVASKSQLRWPALECGVG